MTHDTSPCGRKGTGMKQKVWNTGLLLLLTAALLGGCVLKSEPPVNTRPTPTPEPATAASLLAEAGEKLLEQGGAGWELRGHMSYTSPYADEWADARMELSLTGESVFAPLALHASGTGRMEARGFDMELPLEFYALENEDAAVIYKNVMGAWTKNTVARNGLAAADPGALAADEQLRQAARLAPDTETVEGRSCRRLEIPVSGAMLAAASRDLALTAPESGPELRAVLWLDTETCLPVRLSLSLTEEIIDTNIHVRELELTIDYRSFGAMGSLTPPPEALAAPETAQRG